MAPARLAPRRQVSDMLDRLYTSFDALTEEHDVFKARTHYTIYTSI